VSIKKAIDHLEDDAKIGGREPLDLLKALDESRCARAGLLLVWLESEQLIGGHPQGASEIDQEHSRWLGVLLLVVGDHSLRDADSLGQLGLCQGAALAELSETFSKALQGPFFHG
jgi:hypothetical protein